MDLRPPPQDIEKLPEWYQHLYEKLEMTGQPYVASPHIVDQGSSEPGSIKDLVDAIGSDNATIYLPHYIGSTTTYTVGTNETIPSNIDIKREKGAILSIASGVTLTINGIFESGLDQAFSGDGSVVFGGATREVYPEWWGAAGDGSTDDSTPIQSAIDAMEGGGVVLFAGKTYACINVELKSWVELRGISVSYKVVKAAVYHEKTILKAYATGHILTTTATKIYDAAVRNMGLIGLGEEISLKGIYLESSGKCIFENLAFDWFADQAILDVYGGANIYQRIFTQNCLLDRTQSAKTGAIDINGTDTQMSEIEASSYSSLTPSLSDENAYLCGIVIRTQNGFFDRIIGELSDCGIHITGSFNRFVQMRGDLNWGNGIEISSVTFGNQFIGCTAYRNSRETNNTYSGWVTEGQGSQFIGCFASCRAADTEKHKYGFLDESTSQADGPRRNRYVGSHSYAHATAEFKGVDYQGSSFFSGDQNYHIFTDDDATPDVAGGEFFQETYSNPTTITDFDNGTPGQVITIWATSGNVTIEHEPNIWTNVRGDLVLKAYHFYTFRHANGVWYEIGTPSFRVESLAASSGADGTISSRSTNPLGECQFLRMINDDGEIVYVPCWADITP